MYIGLQLNNVEQQILISSIARTQEKALKLIKKEDPDNLVKVFKIDNIKFFKKELIQWLFENTEINNNKDLEDIAQGTIVFIGKVICDA